MNFRIDRTAFLNELHYLQGVAGARQLIPILSHLLIEARADGIGMRASDLDITMTTECEAEIREEGSICLPVRKLMEIVKSLPHAEIEIRTNDLYQATITCNGSRFKLNGLDADNFPDLQQFSGDYAEISAEIFSRFIPRVIHAAGQEGSRYALNGAKLEITDERIRMVATDGHRLALIEHEGRFEAALDVIVPKKALIELGKLCAGGDGPLRMGKSDNHIHFELGKRRGAACLLAGQYPDYSAVLPKRNHNRFGVGRSDISSAVRRVALMADDRHRAIKMEIGEGTMNITSQSSEIGEAGETVPIEYQGEPITAGFNASYLNDFFNAIDEDEILFEFENGQTQVQLSVANSAYQDRFLSIIMPMCLEVR